MKCQFFHLDTLQVEEIRKICDPGTYRLLDKQEIPSIIPPKLKDTCHSAVVVASSCYNGIVYCINLQRIDRKEQSLDQMPYALVAVPDMAASSCLLHHADYTGRTTHPTEEFWQNVNASGIEKYIQISDFPANKMGDLSELTGSSHEKGFLKAKSLIIKHNDELKGTD